MEPFNNIKEIWHTSNDERTGSPLVTAKLELIIKKRIKRQKKILAGYFWASFFYQVLIYSFLSHFIIRFWNDWRFMILSVIGICLYIPFTILFMKKYKLMLNPPAAVSENISANVQHQYN